MSPRLELSIRWALAIWTGYIAISAFEILYHFGQDLGVFTR